MAAPLEIIENPEAVKALVEPTRRAMVMKLAQEPHTISQLARLLGKTPATIHHHMRTLLDSGLVHLVATRKVNNNLVEKHYGLSTPALCVVGYSLPSPRRGPVPPKDLQGERVIAAVDEASLTEFLSKMGLDTSSPPTAELESLLAASAATAQSVFRQALASQGIALPPDTLRQLEAIAVALPAATWTALLREATAHETLRTLVRKLGIPGEDRG